MRDFLSETCRSDLVCAHRAEKSRRVADRIKAVLLADEGWSYGRIADVLLLDEQTISRHVKEYLSSNKLTLSSGGSSSKLTSFQTSELLCHLTSTTYVRVCDICAYTLSEYGVSYTTPGMTYWLHEHGFSYKRPKGLPGKANPADQEAFIESYHRLLNSASEDEPILFGDGVHPTMATKVTCGWIKTGVDKPIKTTASRSRVNIMGAIDLYQFSINTEYLVLEI